MSPSVNLVQLIGRLGREPDIRYTESGQCRTRFRLATDRPGKTGADPEADWHQVVCWGQVAEFAGEFLTTGRLVYVAGRLSYGSYEGRDGQTRHTVEVVAREVVPLDRRPPEPDVPDDGEAADEGLPRSVAPPADGPHVAR